MASRGIRVKLGILKQFYTRNFLIGYFDIIFASRDSVLVHSDSWPVHQNSASDFVFSMLVVKY